MPVYKDEQRGTWYCCFYYTDWQGKRKRKYKRGFSKQREAKEFERAFLAKSQGSPQMTFKDLADLCFEDARKRLRLVTMQSKEQVLRTQILPYWADVQIANIKPADVRKWQNEIIAKGYAPTTLKIINNQFVSILNYAVKYCGLRENPCSIAGTMGKKKPKEMLFWTKEEYSQFIKVVDRTEIHAAFQIMYWCGLRVGELLALDRGDIDLEKKVIRVTKSQQRIAAKDVITPPKTPKGIRDVVMPDFLCEELSVYLDSLYNKAPETRLFSYSRTVLYNQIVKNSEKAGVKKIRVHDLRHSHVSLLIDMGFSAPAIADRVGHESIDITYNYAHLFPSKQTEMAVKLNVERGC